MKIDLVGQEGSEISGGRGKQSSETDLDFIKTLLSCEILHMHIKCQAVKFSKEFYNYLKLYKFNCEYRQPLYIPYDQMVSKCGNDVYIFTCFSLPCF